jgi:cell division protein FtsQ
VDWRALIASRRARIVAISLVGVLLLLGGGWLWFQDSSLVAVQQVTVTGESGPDAGAIRSALVSAARGMTTLDVQTRQLYSAVSAYPVVRSLQVTTQFPHGMRIHVVEELPVAVVTAAGRRVAVASDGTLLHDLARIPVLPRIVLAVPPGGPRLNEPPALEALDAATAAPRPLLSRISQISTVRGHGVVALLHDGPAVYLGAPNELRRKWAAALAVLDDPGSAGASYIDVTDPGRPAAGVGRTATSSSGH